MKRYPPDYNPIREYWAQILSGETVVGQKIYKTFRHLIRQMDEPGIYYYDARRGNHILEFAFFKKVNSGKRRSSRLSSASWTLKEPGNSARRC